jgi:hypothetical protein
MKHKTAELEGELLDKAVAKALGGQVYDRHPSTLSGTWGAQKRGYTFPIACAASNNAGSWEHTPFRPSVWWEHGGQIIERERIALHPGENSWYAKLNVESPGCIITREGRGPTPLIAAMRAFVASKLGDVVELP